MRNFFCCEVKRNKKSFGQFEKQTKSIRKEKRSFLLKEIYVCFSILVSFKYIYKKSCYGNVLTKYINFEMIIVWKFLRSLYNINK